MFEKKITKTVKSVVKGLLLENGKIVDEDGIERDLNKIVAATFEDGETFDFQINNKADESQINNKADESQIIDEGGESDD